jgi:hypothetical protein
LKYHFFIKQGEVSNAEDQPPRKRRLLLAVVRVEDEQNTVAEKDKEKEGLFVSLVVCFEHKIIRVEVKQGRCRTYSVAVANLMLPRDLFFAARGAYRKHPVISNNLRRPIPGLGIALAAFGVYLFVEGMTSKLASSPAKKEYHH